MKNAYTIAFFFLLQIFAGRAQDSISIEDMSVTINSVNFI